MSAIGRFHCIIKDEQIENQRLLSKINDLEKTVISLEENGNILEQYDRRNNQEITGVLDNVEGYWNTTEDWGKCLNSGYRSLPSSWKFKK